MREITFIGILFLLAYSLMQSFSLRATEKKKKVKEKKVQLSSVEVSQLDFKEHLMPKRF